MHRPASRVRLYLSYEVNKCARVSRQSLDRKKELEKRQRPRAAEAGSLDIIEDDISDYPKDRNLSLSVLYFQLFLSFPEFVAFNSLGKCLELSSHRIRTPIV